MSKQKQKEPLPLMIAKTVLAISVFTGLGTIIIGGGVVIMKYYNSEVNNRIVEPVNQETENYYDVLEKKCAGDNCCLASLKTMRENNYKEADENRKCPEGFNRNMMRCITSYQWCVPMEEDCKKHGEMPDYISHTDNPAAQCCKGLKCKLPKKYFDKDCVNLYEKYGAGGYAGICINCGDGICDEEFENKCNCSEDCGEENDTSDWQTYRNEEFGFEFGYPKNDFSFKEHSAEYLFLSRHSRRCVVSFRVDKIKNEQSFSDYLCERNISVSEEQFDVKCEKFLYQEQLSGPGPVSKEYLGEKEISENISAEVISWNNRGEVGDIYYILNDTEVIIISVTDSWQCKEEEVRQILSSFKFIES